MLKSLAIGQSKANCTLEAPRITNLILFSQNLFKFLEVLDNKTPVKLEKVRFKGTNYHELDTGEQFEVEILDNGVLPTLHTLSQQSMETY